jgi:hypothetical protein
MATVSNHQLNTVRRTARLFAVLLSILLAVTFSGLAMVTGDSATQGPAAPISPENPTVEYCQLIRNPSLYDQKVVRLRAIYVRSGSATSKLYSFECDYYGSTWVEFKPTYGSCTKREQLEKLARMERDSRPYPKNSHPSIILISYCRAEVVLVGKFEAVLPEKVGGEKELPDPQFSPNNLFSMVKTDYAHYYHYKHLLTVNCVEEVKPLPLKAP